MDTSSLFLNQVATMFPRGICKLLEIQCWAADGNTPNFYNNDDTSILSSLPVNLRPLLPVERRLTVAFLKILFVDHIAKTEEEKLQINSITPAQILNQNIYKKERETISDDECTFKQPTKIRRTRTTAKPR